MKFTERLAISYLKSVHEIDTYTIDESILMFIHFKGIERSLLIA